MDIRHNDIQKIDFQTIQPVVMRKITQFLYQRKKIRFVDIHLVISLKRSTHCFSGMRMIQSGFESPQMRSHPEHIFHAEILHTFHMRFKIREFLR